MAHEIHSAPLVTVKTKYQVTLPTSIRRKADVSIGDILEAKVEGNKITLTPKGLIDRELALAMEDVRRGRTYGPFGSPAEMIRDMKKRVAERKKHRA